MATAVSAQMSNRALAVVPKETMPDFEEAKFAFEQLLATYEKIELKRDGLRLALNVNEHGLNPDASAEFKAKAAVFRDYAKRYPRRALVDIEDAEVELELMRPELNAASARYTTYLEVEADRFARSLIPRHRVAVAGIARALENLSAALAEEAAIQEELQTAQPQYPRSPHIPHMSAAFAGCRLDIPESLASAWARSARALIDR